MTMTRDQLITIVRDRTGASLSLASQTVNDMLHQIGSTLGRGEAVELSGFGRFSVEVFGPKRGMNPRTGEPLQIEARHKVKFKAGIRLREAIAPAQQAAA